MPWLQIQSIKNQISDLLLDRSMPLIGKSVCVILMTAFVSTSDATELSEKCQTEMLQSLKEKSLSMLFPVYLQTDGGKIDGFIGSACSKGKQEIEIDNKKRIFVKLKVNPWADSAIKELTVNCDPKHDFPIVEVRVIQVENESDCLITLTQINSSFKE